MMFTKYFSVLIFIFVLSGLSSTAYTQCLVTNGNDMGAGSLRNCIEIDADPVVNIDPSVTDITLAGEIIFSSNKTVNGNNATVDGDGMGRIFSTVDDGSGPFDIELNDLMLTGGNGAGTTSNGSGGAIYNAGHDFTINRSNIFSNAAAGLSAGGGGIRSESGMAGAGSLTVNQTTIDNNSATFGGGIFLGGTSISTINDSTISNNMTSQNGGGLILNDTSVVTITNSTICDNETQSLGGGARVTAGATLNLVHVTVADNEADTNGANTNDGGGISDGGTVNTTNVLILGNISGMAATLNNCDNTVDMNTGDSSSDDTTCYTRSPAADPTDVSMTLEDNGGLTLTKNVLSSSNIATQAAGNCEATDQRGFDRAATNCTPGAVEALDIGTISITVESLDALPPTDFTSTNFPDGCELQSPFTLNNGGSGVCVVPVDVTEYTVTETVPPGFELAISCTEIGTGPPTSTDDTNNPTVNIEIVDDGDEVSCVFTNSDIDDCTPDPCLNGGVCTDTGAESFDCDCSGTGYEGDICDMDIDSCVNNPCDANATCTDLAPPALDDTDGRTCECNAGFIGDGEPGNCDLVNECIAMTDNCEQLCFNTEEGFDCGCSNGFLLQPDGFSCEPADVNIDIGNEETDEDGLRVLIEVGSDISGTGMLLVNLPSEVESDCASIGSFGTCSNVEAGETSSVAFEDADVICEIDNFPSGGAMELELCLCGKEGEGVVDAEIEVIADNAPGSQFDELVQIFLEELNGCGGGDGCGTVVGKADTKAVAGNVFVSLLPLVVGFAGLFWRRRNSK